MSFSTLIDHNKYPSSRCWNRVHMAIARITGSTCERCGQRCSRKKFTVHHIGAPYADGRPGDPHDKHDLRRENLQGICNTCHCELEPERKDYLCWKKRQRRKKRAHHSQGVGTGLVPYVE